MLTIVFTGYCLIAALMAIWIAADRKSWLTKLPGAGAGASELDFVLAFLWGLAWPITLVIWMTKTAPDRDEKKQHDD
jgi:hypothetical protein